MAHWNQHKSLPLAEFSTVESPYSCFNRKYFSSLCWSILPTAWRLAKQQEICSKWGCSWLKSFWADIRWDSWWKVSLATVLRWLTSICRNGKSWGRCISLWKWRSGGMGWRKALSWHLSFIFLFFEFIYLFHDFIKFNMVDKPKKSSKTIWFFIYTLTNFLKNE